MFRVRALGACIAALAAWPASAGAAQWVTGDVFAAVGGGHYAVYDNAGNFKEMLASPINASQTPNGTHIAAGCAVSANGLFGTLYTADPNQGLGIWALNDPHAVSRTLASPISAESVVFDSSGNFYVGHSDYDRSIVKYDSAGNVVATYKPAIDRRGTDWIDLAADQKTIYYTGEGRKIKRYDVSTQTQLPDFATLPAGGPDYFAYAFRLLPPGDGSGGVLVADDSKIVRLDAGGNIVQTYTAPGEANFFALNLDPNGTSFWSGDLVNRRFYRFNLANGAVEVGPIQTSPPAGTPQSDTSLSGLCVFGEITAAGPPPPPPTSISPTPVGPPMSSSPTTPPKVTGAKALPLPSARRCTSRRAFPIRVRQYRGLRYEVASVTVNRRRVPVFVYTTRRIKVTRIGARYLNRKRFRAFVDLRGLVKGTYSVRVVAITIDGQILSNTRRYRTCSRKLAGGIPRL